MENQKEIIVVKLNTEEIVAYLNPKEFEDSVTETIKSINDTKSVCVLGDMLCKCKARTFENFLNEGCEYYVTKPL